MQGDFPVKNRCFKTSHVIGRFFKLNSLYLTMHEIIHFITVYFEPQNEVRNLYYKREREFFITLNMVPPVLTGIIISKI